MPKSFSSKGMVTARSMSVFVSSQFTSSHTHRWKARVMSVLR